MSACTKDSPLTRQAAGLFSLLGLLFLHGLCGLWRQTCGQASIYPRKPWLVMNQWQHIYFKTGQQGQAHKESQLTLVRKNIKKRRLNTIGFLTSSSSTTSTAAGICGTLQRCCHTPQTWSQGVLISRGWQAAMISYDQLGAPDELPSTYDSTSLWCLISIALVSPTSWGSSFRHGFLDFFPTSSSRLSTTQVGRSLPQKLRVALLLRLDFVSLPLQHFQFRPGLPEAASDFGHVALKLFVILMSKPKKKKLGYWSTKFQLVVIRTKNKNIWY